MQGSCYRSFMISISTFRQKVKIFNEKFIKDLIAFENITPNGKWHICSSQANAPFSEFPHFKKSNSYMCYYVYTCVAHLSNGQVVGLRIWGFLQRGINPWTRNEKYLWDALCLPPTRRRSEVGGAEPEIWQSPNQKRSITIPNAERRMLKNKKINKMTICWTHLTNIDRISVALFRNYNLIGVVVIMSGYVWYEVYQLLYFWYPTKSTTVTVNEPVLSMLLNHF